MKYPELMEMLAWADDSSLRLLLVAGIAVVLALLVHRVGLAVLLRLTRSMPVAEAVVRQCRAPAQLLLPLVALQAVWQGAPDDLALIGGVRHANALLLFTALTWLGLRAVRGVAHGVTSLHPVDVEDNLHARRIHTQTRMLARTAMFTIVLTGLALMLMTFPGARQFGTSLLASAGVVGLVVGIAARPIFSNLIAGLQIALAQPIRLDDVVTYVTYLEVNNTDLSLRPGMTAAATIVATERIGVLLVPNTALRFTPTQADSPAAAASDGSFVSKLMPRMPRTSARKPADTTGGAGTRQVWVLKDNQATAVSVKTGISDGRMTEVTGDGLQEGMAVITDQQTAGATP